MAKAQPKKEETPTKNTRPAEAENLPARTRQNRFAINRNMTSPFTLMRHIAEDMENMLDDFGAGGRLFAPGFTREFFRPDFSWFEETPLFSRRENLFRSWSPQVDVFEREGKLVVQAELPGINKDDIKVDITDRQLTIEGERREEKEEKDEGFYRSERSYGGFYREIPLPEGVNTENARAEFKNGVLEISMDAPQLAAGKRRLEITGGEPKKAASGK